MAYASKQRAMLKVPCQPMRESGAQLSRLRNRVPYCVAGSVGA
ncbi:hypothetical protein AMP9_4573 [plant metagenome]|uniref:Uncharacterized protein n=1 Tax=plant metagenome TaxID=1297885 RepID=A0A484PWV5_9ZZZZ